MGHPQTLVGFVEMYPTREARRRALFEQRRREGFRCPPCAHEAAWYLRGRGLHECAGCNLPSLSDRGHAAHKTRTDLRQWLLRRKTTHAMRSAELGSGRRGHASQRKALVAVSAEQSPSGGFGRAHVRAIDDTCATTLRKAAGAMIQADLSKVEKLAFWAKGETVSYTHLTLPTNREV